MKIAILGATGKTGGPAMQTALATGHHVRVLARDPAKLGVQHANLEVIAGDATSEASCAELVAGCDAVIAAIGPPHLKKTTLREDIAKALVPAMKSRGVKRVVWLSAIGVGDSKDQTRRTSFFVSRVFIPLVLKTTYLDVQAAEDVLIASGLDYVICRPPGLTDKKPTGVMEVISLDRKLPRIRCTRADVGAWMAKAATESTYDRQAVTIC